MANIYPAGSLVTVATYTGPVDDPVGGFLLAGVLADPDFVTLQYQPGQGASLVVVTYPDVRIVRDGTGLYRANLDTTGTRGPWPYGWFGTGGVQAAMTSAFIVQNALPFG